MIGYLPGKSGVKINDEANGQEQEGEGKCHMSPPEAHHLYYLIIN
jgi:hypothetical protein